MIDNQEEMLLDISSKLRNFILETQGTQLALQSCIGSLTRAMGQLRRHTESLCKKLEGLVKYEILTMRAETEEDLSRLSLIVSSTRETAMMNKLQIDLLRSASSCSAMMDTTTAEEEKIDKEIAAYIQKLQIRKDAREKGEKSPALLKMFHHRPAAKKH